MAFAIDRSTPPPFYPFFTPLFVLLQLNLTYMKRILNLVLVKIIILKSSFNWFKYRHYSAAPAADCQQLVYSAIFMVTSTTICI